MGKKRVIQESDESDDDVPLAKRAKDTETSPPPDVKPVINGNGHAAPAPPAEPVAVKAEAREPSLKRPAPSSSDDDAPLAAVAPKKEVKKAKPSRSPSASTSLAATPAAASASEDSDEDDAPLSQQVKPKPAAKSNGDSKKRPKKKASSEDDEDDDFDESEEDVKPKKKKVSKPKAEKEKPVKAKTTKADKGKDVKPKVKAEEEESKPKKKAKKVKAEESGGEGEEGEEGEDYKWWVEQQANGDGSVKWTTLEHNGVLFPPEYEPHGVKMRYDGKELTLPPESEEVATFFAAMMETDHAEKDVFRENFFNDFKDVLKEFPPVEGIQVKSFDKCDFRPIFEHCEAERLKKKSLSKDQKKQIKDAKDAIEEPFKICLLNGRKEKVGNFRVEPPGLFRGRGKHPKTGMLKKRVRPEQITINIGENAKVPEPPPGHKWGKIIHDNTVSWLAGWNENINGAFKYVFLAAGSSLKGQSDLKKYERARELKKHIDRIRKDYRADLTNKLMADRQRATALYLIDLFALRAGNEKGDDEADTVGCCSLRCEHITLSPPAHVQFDFLGKDSIRYLNDVDVDEQVHKNLRIFKKNKNDDDLLFDRISTTIMNKHLTEYMSGLTAKVFRTYNASWTFQNELDKTNEDDSVPDKILAYNRANRQVAILCNHQKSVSKGHSAAMDKMNDKLRALKYQRMKLRHALFTLDSKAKKSHPELAEDESDLDDDWIATYEEEQNVKDKDKATKKFEKDNEKLVADGEKAQSKSVLEEKHAELDENLKRLKKERKSKNVEAKGRQTSEKLVAAIEKMDDRIKAHRVQTLDKDEGKTTSLGTSKLNYLDPRLTFAWCKKYEVPIEKMFSKTLREKFTWAADVDEDWRF